MSSTLIWGVAIGISLGMWASTFFINDPDLILNYFADLILVAVLVGWMVSVNRSSRRRDAFEECDWPAPGDELHEEADGSSSSGSGDRTVRPTDRTVLPSGSSLPPFRRVQT